MTSRPVVIVGAGLAGLACARRLHRSGFPFLLLEAESQVGGRVRTDHHQGFLLDHGFQVLLTAYPEAKAVLDYPALGLRPFSNGAFIRIGRSFHPVGDPWRDIGAGLRTLASPIGTMRDKLLVAALRRRACSGSLASLFARTEIPIQDYLRETGFSDTMIDRFFRPFYGGILLDRDLSASSRMFEFVFRMLALGDTTLPKAGMRAIPHQMASRLPDSSIRLDTTVHSLTRQSVVLESGEQIEAQAVVVATEGPAAARWLDSIGPVLSRPVVCVYYAAQRPPLRHPGLVLNGNSSGLINNLCVPSNVQPSYSPPGFALISVSVVGQPPADSDVWEPAVRRELRDWFGRQVDRWTHLRTYQIRHAQPDQNQSEGEERPVRAQGFYVCGDHRATPSINGALLSGRRAAEAVLQDLSR
jgi:phytoene dehydrogenase-like protein